MLNSTILSARWMEVLTTIGVGTLEFCALDLRAQGTLVFEILFLDIVDSCDLIEVCKVSCLNFWEPKRAEEVHILLVFS